MFSRINHLIISLVPYHHFQSSEACGGPNFISVYSSVPVVVLPIPVPMTVDLPGNWTYAGCLREPATGKIFPYMNEWIGNNSALACMNQCAAFGYPAAGVEVSLKKSLLYVISELTRFIYSSMVYNAVRFNCPIS